MNRSDLNSREGLAQTLRESAKPESRNPNPETRIPCPRCLHRLQTRIPPCGTDDDPAERDPKVRRKEFISEIWVGTALVHYNKTAQA